MYEKSGHNNRHVHVVEKFRKVHLNISSLYLEKLNIKCNTFEMSGYFPYKI
jgi:hypothetical protein